MVQGKISLGIGEGVAGDVPTHRGGSLSQGLVDVTRFPEHLGFQRNLPPGPQIITHFGLMQFKGVDLGGGIVDVSQRIGQEELATRSKVMALPNS